MTEREKLTEIASTVGSYAWLAPKHFGAVQLDHDLYWSTGWGRYFCWLCSQGRWAAEAYWSKKDLMERTVLNVCLTCCFRFLSEWPILSFVTKQGVVLCCSVLVLCKILCIPNVLCIDIVWIYSCFLTSVVTFSDQGYVFSVFLLAFQLRYKSQFYTLMSHYCHFVYSSFHAQ